MRGKRVLEDLKIIDSEFPNIGIGKNEEGFPIYVKNALQGQTVKVKLGRKKEDRIEAKLLEVVERSPMEKESQCIHFSECGGCTYQRLDYDEELNYKLRQINNLFVHGEIDHKMSEIIPSPKYTNYRNKMEYTFGDEYKDGPLSVGLHARGRFHDIVNTSRCEIVHDDFNVIREGIREYFEGIGVSYYKRRLHEGSLRHLVVRRGEYTKEILLNLVTTSDVDFDMEAFVEYIKSVELEGEVVGIIHTINDSLGDAITPEKVELLYGRDYFYEEILGLRFKISPFSFFQTNTKSAEVLYSKALGFISELDDKIVFDLYSGTGTISQIAGLKAKKVYGIEIVEEAVVAARENAKLNGLKNVEFLAEDVLTGVDKLEAKPDVVIIDPPREGINPKAINKIIDFDPEEFLYISCNPKTFVRDLKVFMERGYKIKESVVVDQFPRTSHVETIALLQRDI
ncbi:MAG: 23S rRNA (uracil(1939)-C(5))-methyltransferase RlmD [Tissierellia bacterium]|nr:23S rRNA (uracil(1939)-C(5))-methyltransferase RlmD [Tissierellia bacterium]